MSEDKEVFVHKVTLGSGKTVMLRDPRIKDQELAIQAASTTVGSDNQVVLAVGMQKELLKMLLVQVNDKKLEVAQKEDLDSLFSYMEYNQLLQVLEKLTGGAEKMGNFQMELVNSGAI